MWIAGSAQSIAEMENALMKSALIARNELKQVPFLTEKQFFR